MSRLRQMAGPWLEDEVDAYGRMLEIVNPKAATPEAYMSPLDAGPRRSVHDKKTRKRRAKNKLARQSRKKNR